MDKHNFWKTQSIQDTTKKSKISEPEIINKFNDNIYPRENNTLPANYIWDIINHDNEKDIDDLYIFLYNNYNHETDKFGGHYSKENLKWYLKQTQKYSDLYFCIKSNGKIVACIIGLIQTISIFEKIYTMSESTLLCIDKTIRHMNLAPLIIKEIFRRYYHNKINLTYYTSYLKLPNILTNITYYTRVLNVKKMLAINYISKPSIITLNAFEKIYRVKNKPSLQLRKMTENDIKQCTNKYNEFYKKFKIRQIFTEQEFKNRFLPINNVIDSYVIEKNNIITDFISIYYLNVRVFNDNNYNNYSLAQIYHYFYSNEKIFIEMIDDILYLMKEKNIDVINATNQMDNHLFFNTLKFKQKNLENNFYIWNLMCPEITSKDIGVVTI